MQIACMHVQHDKRSCPRVARDYDRGVGAMEGLPLAQVAQQLLEGDTVSSGMAG